MELCIIILEIFFREFDITWLYFEMKFCILVYIQFLTCKVLSFKECFFFCKLCIYEEFLLMSQVNLWLVTWTHVCMFGYGAVMKLEMCLHALLCHLRRSLLNIFFLNRYEEFKFGCTSLRVPPDLLYQIRHDITVSPNGVAFVKVILSSKWKESTVAYL